MTTPNRKFISSALTVLTLLALIYPTAWGAPLCCQYNLSIPKGIYVGIFGGGGHSGDNNASQTGTAFFAPANGGPLAVNANGNTGGSAGIAGMHIGYAWPDYAMCKGGWNLTPAVELEGYYLRSNQEGDLLNPNARIPEHSFVDTFPMHTGVFLANAVWTLETPYTNKLYPYLGVGIGAAIISINGANSKQIHPPEPGINHFNSNTHSTDGTFAGQAKAGLRFNLTNNWRLFAEYRFLYLSSTNYKFGSTQYPTHVPTTRWNVNIGNMIYNMGALGIEYSV